MLDDEITFNFKVSIIYCYPSKLKHSQNVYFKVKGNCYNMSPFFIQCAKLFYKFQIYYDVSLNLRQYTPISKMDSCLADRLLYRPFSGSVHMQPSCSYHRSRSMIFFMSVHCKLYDIFNSNVD